MEMVNVFQIHGNVMEQMTVMMVLMEVLMKVIVHVLITIVQRIISVVTMAGKFC